MTSARLGRLSAWRRADVALAALIVAIVCMMVVPLPTQLVDLFIAINMALSFLLLATALYVRETRSFAAFPAIILLATLYRLSLNVASTRLILLQADAGRVIEAFGTFVVRGDYLVGALVFSLLTIVQFLVIAKGAERVAEVSARFSLDAMPGKQMAIDAELRAGSLSAEAARTQRRALERESQLYGAMDGAMKFVKGDAVAGIVITLVNFVGGVAIGTTARGLPIKKSLAVYGLLTIGDGLASQIPALLCATAAALVVTRVASDDPTSSMGVEIGRQLFGDTRVLLAGTLVLVLLALVPGLPAWPFALTAAACGTLFVRAQSRETPAIQGAELASSREPRFELLKLELGPGLFTELTERGRASSALERTLRDVRERLSRTLGLELPVPSLALARALPERTFRLVWRELNCPPREAADDALSAIAGELERLASAHADDLLGLEQVELMLARVERREPALVRLTVPRPVSPTLLAEILRRLARERVSVRFLPEILEALAPLAPTETDPLALTEAVRRALGRRITQALAPEGRLHVLRLAPEVEEALEDALSRNGPSAELALDPELARDICQATSSAHKRAPRPHALVTSRILRPHVRALIASAAPALVVVSAHELTSDLALEQGELIGP